jgi:XTP/dITP diphosphohydrolase
MIQLLVASRNRHKIQEIRQILGLGEVGFVRGLDEMADAPKLIEDASSFSGNATRKAWQLAEWLMADPRRLGTWDASGRLVVLADDSGLEVDALHGAPGVHSARFANLGVAMTGNASDKANNDRLLHLLQSVPVGQRNARFRCVLAVLELRPIERGAEGTVNGLEPGPARCYEGVCEGKIGLAPRGSGGFGYDPLFIPDGAEETFAELGEASKNRLSHRYRALERVKAWLGSL